MKTIGITGGVGMGKTTAERFLRSSGFLVVDTDLLARELVEPGQPALMEIQSLFGPEVISGDGTLNRAELARIVFADTTARRELEGILHPRIRDGWRARVAAHLKEPGAELVFVVIPLLYETGAEKEVDSVICIASSSATQARRLRERGWSDHQIRQRVLAQMPAEEKMRRAQFVVWNEAGLDVLESQLTRILGALTAARHPERV